MTPFSELFPDEKLAFVVGIFEAEGIPYAVGGAIALFYWGEPRATADIDINIFLPAASAGEVGAALANAGVGFDLADFERQVARVAQVRIDFGGTALDLFFSELPFHESCSRRSVRVPFGQAEMQVLSAEDLVICKVMFNRNKDWMDIEQVLLTRGERFESAYAEEWLAEMLGDGSEGLERFRGMWRATLHPGAE